MPSSSDIYIAALHVATHGMAHDLPLAKFKAAVGSHPHFSQSGETSESAAARHGFRPAKTALYLWTIGPLRAEPDSTVAQAFRRHKTDPRRRFNLQAARAKLCEILSSMARNGTDYAAPPPTASAQPDAQDQSQDSVTP